MRIGPFEIETNECWTECECPPSLCKHEDGFRAYNIWIVWDVENDDHASLTRRDEGFRFADSYDNRRDALADVRRYLERIPA